MSRPSGPAVVRSMVLLAVLATPMAASAADIGVSSAIAEIELIVDLFDEDVPLGGLSGLTYDPGCDLFYALTDDRGYIADPRVYAFKLDLAGPKVRPIEVVTLRDGTGEPFARGVLDPEAVDLAPNGVLWVATEGEASRGLAPRIMAFGLDGTMTGELEIPESYVPGENRGVRSNHGFEGMSVSPDGSRLVAAVESALVQDGPDADLHRGTTVRLLVFDSATRIPISERAYRVEPVPEEPRPPRAYRSIGVSEILALDEHRLLVVERSFSAGVGNTVRVFLADLETGDDITGAASLPADVKPVEKSLVVDLADLGIDPDNIEGLAFGPVLPDGRSTLVMVADNNFQPEVQSNQLLVLAVSGAASDRPPRPAASINDIQAAAHVSPLVGRCVAGVRGTVTAILGQRRGQAFWVQQTDGDDRVATSEGLFVTALDGLATVAVGDAVRLSGRVEEPLWRMELPVTRLVADGLEIMGNDRQPPPAVLIGEGGRQIPTPNIDDDGLTLFEPETDAIDFFESLEGMLVRVNDAVVVGPTSNYGDIVVLGDGGSGARPRSRRGGVVIQPEKFHPERIMISDRLVDDPPAVKVGDRLAGEITGVLHYSYGSYKVLNTAPVSVEAVSAVEPGSSTLVADGNHITVATLNVENLHRASNEGKFAALAEIIVHRLGAPTMVALQEIQDDSGPEDDGTVRAERTLDRLVSSIEASGGPRYRWTQVDPANNADGGRPGGNIRAALLFDSGRITLTAAEETPLAANPTVLGSDDPAFNNSRKPLAVELEIDGERFSVIVCHLRSKGGDDPLFGRRQPPVRSSERQRTAQTELIRGDLDRRLGVDPSARIIVLGDLNDFEFSDAVGILAAEPMVNLMKLLPEPERMTYVYRGNSQILDHIIVSPALADGTEVEVLHVNSEFPASERASDHDPVIARIELQ